MPPDPGDDGVPGTGNDKRIPCRHIVGDTPGRAHVLRYFGGDGAKHPQRDDRQTGLTTELQKHGSTLPKAAKLASRLRVL